MYYFYRFTEAPIDAKRRPAAEKSAMRGSVLNVAMSAGGKLKRVQEEGSERQVRAPACVRELIPVSGFAIEWRGGAASGYGIPH